MKKCRRWRVSFKTLDQKGRTAGLLKKKGVCSLLQENEIPFTSTEGNDCGLSREEMRTNRE